MPVKHADEKRKKSLKILLFGDAGTGKTHFALMATPGKTLIFDAESGADFFEGQEGFSFDYWADDDGYKSASIKELQKAIKYLGSVEGRKKYETFVIDPISDIWDEIQFQRGEYKDVMNSRKDQNKQRTPVNETDMESFNQKDWGDMKRVYKSLMLDLKNLSQNVFLLAREKEILETKSANNIVRTGEYTFEGEKNTKYAIDLVVRIGFDEDEDERWAKIVKTRAQGVKKGQKFTNPTFKMFDAVVNKMVGGKEAAKSSTKKEENLFKETAEEVQTEKEVTLNDQITELCKKLGGRKNEDLMATLKKYEKTGNYNRITNQEDLQKLLTELQNMPVKEKEIENALSE